MFCSTSLRHCHLVPSSNVLLNVWIHKTDQRWVIYSFYDASAAQKLHASNSTTQGVMDKIQPLVAAIDQYGKALDVYANAYPLVMSPLWGR